MRTSAPGTRPWAPACSASIASSTRAPGTPLAFVARVTGADGAPIEGRLLCVEQACARTLGGVAIATLPSAPRAAGTTRTVTLRDGDRPLPSASLELTLDETARPTAIGGGCAVQHAARAPLASLALLAALLLARFLRASAARHVR